MRLIKFEQPNCVPCRSVDQFLRDSGVFYERYMAFDHPAKAAEFGIMSVPVVILLDKDDNEITRSVGYKPAELKEIVSRLL